MTAKIIPLPEPTARTKYSNSRYEKLLKEDDANRIKEWTIYVLWECSTEFMVGNGMPTDADVKHWISWLQQRSDSASKDIQSALGACSEYLKPEPARA